MVVWEHVGGMVTAWKFEGDGMGAALVAMGIGENSDNGRRRCGCMELTHIEVMEERFVRSNERARVEGRIGLEYGEYMT